MERNIKSCVECGKKFACPPSSKKITCSKECSRKRRSRLLKGHEVSPEARAKISAASKGVFNKALLLGTFAAQASPKAGRFDTHSCARDWILVSPENKKYYCTNLSNFIRNHLELFERYDGETDEKMTYRISRGFTTIKRHVKYNLRGIYYKGWTVEIPEIDVRNCEKK
ncbi:MAG: hypothetical protein ACI4JA_11690 [Oscillospiraceae bacterium]